MSNPTLRIKDSAVLVIDQPILFSDLFEELGDPGDVTGAALQFVDVDDPYFINNMGYPDGRGYTISGGSPSRPSGFPVWSGVFSGTGAANAGISASDFWSMSITLHQENVSLVGSYFWETPANTVVGWDQYGGNTTFALSAASTPVVSIADSQIQEGNSGSQMMTFTVSLSKPLDVPLTVDYTVRSNSNGAVFGEDHEGLYGTVTFGAGATTATITVPILGDTVPEGNETFTVEISPQVPIAVTLGQGGRSVATGTILNDDVAPADPYRDALDLSSKDMVKWAIERLKDKLGDSPEDRLLVLEAARAEILKVRDLDSTNEAARDAEYYLIGAYGAAAGDPERAGMALGSPVYAGWKAAANFFGLGASMQADPGKLNSAPGGVSASYEGLIDGLQYREGKGPIVEIFERQDGTIVQPQYKLFNASSLAPAETVTIPSNLALGGAPEVTVELYRSLAVPLDDTGRIVFDRTDSKPLRLGSGDDVVFGATKRNVVDGSRGDDIVFGEGGNDRLKGGAGIDLLDAGKGADQFTGGKGHDLLFGGTDRAGDVFIFVSRKDSPVGARHDVVYNFTSRADYIDLRGIDADPSVRGNNSFDFSGRHPEDHAVWWKAKGQNILLRADVNGDAIADFEILLKNLASIREGDLLL